ncbi:hypothetical protein MKX03_023373 [Papaver bracteatum]|nr:hypothetical protein MKX03_023373 [Papaver bracteatum]
MEEPTLHDPSHKDQTVEEPTLHDPSHKDQTMEEPPLRDPSHKDQTMEEPPLHDQPDPKIDDGYASSSVSTVEEPSFDSGYGESESDEECTSQGASSSVDEVITTPAPAPSTGSYHTDDSDDEATPETGSAKPTGDVWKKFWPKEGAKTESAGVNVYGF